jgi:hypothetical protein
MTLLISLWQATTTPGTNFCNAMDGATSFLSWDYQSSMQNYPLSLYVLVSNTTSGHPLMRGCTLQQRMHPCSGIIENVDIQFKT